MELQNVICWIRPLLCSAQLQHCEQTMSINWCTVNYRLKLQVNPVPFTLNDSEWNEMLLSLCWNENIRTSKCDEINQWTPVEPWVLFKMNHSCERPALSIIDTGPSARHIRRHTCQPTCGCTLDVFTNSNCVDVYSALNASGFWRCVPVNNFISKYSENVARQTVAVRSAVIRSRRLVVAAAQSKILFLRCRKFEVNSSKSIHRAKYIIASDRWLRRCENMFISSNTQPHIFIQAVGCVKWTKQLKCTKNGVCFWCAKQKRIWLTVSDVIRTWMRAFGRLLFIAGFCFHSPFPATTLSRFCFATEAEVPLLERVYKRERDTRLG